jgi:GTP cyclohydrolase II
MDAVGTAGRERSAMFTLVSRFTRSGPEGDEYALPPKEILASFHAVLEEGGPALMTLLRGEERPGRERLVLVASIGRRTAEPLVRVHSSCLLGETMGATDCDCRPQLQESLRRMRAAGSGILIYLDQEGRGAGLALKGMVYEQAERFDLDRLTAYDQLGFPHDLRTYGDAVRVLRLLNVDRCRLLTNNEAKLRALVDAGIAVRRQRLGAGRGPGYLEAG